MCVQILLARWLASPPAGRATVSMALGDDDRLKILQARAAAGSSNTNGLPAFSLPQAVACHLVDGADGVTRLAGAFEALEADGGELGFDTEWRPASLYDGCPAPPAAGSPFLWMPLKCGVVFAFVLFVCTGDPVHFAREVFFLFECCARIHVNYVDIDLVNIFNFDCWKNIMSV